MSREHAFYRGLHQHDKRAERRARADVEARVLQQAQDASPPTRRGSLKRFAGQAQPLFDDMKRHLPSSLRLVLLVIVLGLAALLRFVNLPGNPGWYTDEGAHLDVAWHLSQGRFQFLAITQSTLLPARLPLFELLLAAGLSLQGEGMAILRALTASLGVASVGLLGLFVWAGRERRTESAPTGRGLTAYDALALLAMGLYAVYQPAVLYSRFGFSYSLLTPLVLVAGIGLTKYWETRRWRWLMMASLAVGLGLVSDIWMGLVAAPVLLGALERQWRRWVPRALVAGLVMLLPVGLYAALMLATAPNAFLFDLRYTLGRVGAVPLWLQPGVLVDNLRVLSTQVPWFAVGVVGLLALPSRLRLVNLLLFALPFLLLGRVTALYSLSFYYLIPLLPFIPLGLAALVWQGSRWLVPRLARLGQRTQGFAGAIIILAAAGFIALSFSQVYAQAKSEFVTPVDEFLLNPVEVRAAAAYVNAHVRPADLVIASPGLAWLVCGRGATVSCHVADFQMAVAAAGQATPHMPANLPPDRWAFDPRFAQARFVVVDNLWRNWAAVHIPQVAALLRADENWHVAFVSGDITVYYVPGR